MICPIISTRLAEQSDLELVLAFIQKKAAFDRSLGAFSGELQATRARLQKTLFKHPAFASVFLAEIDRESAPKPIGFALYYFRYSSFAARPSLWLDDLFIDQAMRRQGAGLALMQRLAPKIRLASRSMSSWAQKLANNRVNHSSFAGNLSRCTSQSLVTKADYKNRVIKIG
jgi:GNAT superfamily N-acetyltransferase